MDLQEMIRQLLFQKKQVERAIAMLEELQDTSDGLDAASVTNRRGRKAMGPDERHQVSERMKKYWASRKRPSA